MALEPVKQWGGLNKRVSKTDIDAGESPDCSNCFLAKNKVGQLGQRLGKTFVNTTAYLSEVNGLLKFVLPGGSQSIIPLANGDVNVTNTNEANPHLVFITGNSATGKAMTTTSLTLTYPTTSASLITTFSDLSTYDGALSTFASWGYIIGGTFAGGTTSDTRMRVRFGTRENAQANYCFTQDLTIRWGTTASFSGGTPCGIHGSGTISGMCIEISWPDGAWPTGSGAGDHVTFSSLLMG